MVIDLIQKINLKRRWQLSHTRKYCHQTTNFHKSQNPYQVAFARYTAKILSCTDSECVTYLIALCTFCKTILTFL